MERCVPQIGQVRPEYAEMFRCIGSACEDTCCQGWSVLIDREAFEKYQHLPAGPLRGLIDASILVTSENASVSNGSSTENIAKMRMTESNQCPMLSAEHLCRIQAERGEAFLPHPCATYPRIIHSIGGIDERALALSCPEAARLVLLNSNLMQPVKRLALPVEGEENCEGHRWLPPYFWSIREVVLGLIQNRAYPLWQRLFLIGAFCRRQDAMANGTQKRSATEFLGEFEAAVASGTLQAAMETMPSRPSAQLDVVLRLAGLMLRRSNVRPRFVECIEAFKQGIGNGPGATLESLTAKYALAHDRFYAPFIARHPHIMENYLTNTIFRCQFPYGRGGMQKGSSGSMAREFALLTAQFALMRGLLIGVSGFHREKFSAEHVVHTVQAASKHFEHHPEFLNLTHAFLVENEMDGAQGLTILIRNPESIPANPKSPANSGLWQDDISALIEKKGPA
jgi:lysine-N-methylase